MPKGLSTETAQEKLRIYGPNEISQQEILPTGKVFIDVIKEPMIFLLICCTVLYFLMGDKTESIILFLMIGMIVMISFFQRTFTICFHLSCRYTSSGYHDESEQAGAKGSGTCKKGFHDQFKS